MRVFQLLPTLTYGDAIGNDTLAIRKILLEMGVETGVYAENIGDRLPEGVASYISEMPELTEEDVILYHCSTGTELNERLPQMTGRKVMIYHNITPQRFFDAYSPNAKKLTQNGLRQMLGLADKLDYCIADSAYNQSDLLRAGFNCSIDVCPVLIPFADYEKEPDAQTMRELDDGKINLLFVGRIAPNKKQENVIRAFYFYHKYYQPQSRLVLAGSWGGMEKYYERLCDYVKALGLEDDVVFTGHVSFERILAYYQKADAFVCMSEHEGFCVPLVEAMYFGVPIVAYDATAVPDTLGDSGVLLRDNSPIAVAGEIDRLIRDEAWRREIVKGEKKRLEDFRYERVSKRLKALLHDFIKGRPSKKRRRIIQLATTLSRGDAIGNDILAIQEEIVRMGYPSPIYIEILNGKGLETFHELSQLPQLEEEDIVLYHHGTGTDLSGQFAALPCKKVMVYHNVTPPEFFAPYDAGAVASCQQGLDNLQEMCGRIDVCLADSGFNQSDLIARGYDCPIQICPILIPFEDYAQAPDQAVLERMRDGRSNIIFVGRVAPNKKFEDVISAFAAYKKRDPNARLTLVGSYDPEGAYYRELLSHVQKLGVQDVYFTGHIPFAEILAYYRSADAFVCMSEHEGFCVPLVEAMYFDVPIVAFAGAAIPETLDGSGVLLQTKEPEAVAEAIDRVIHDGEFRTQIIKGQQKRLVELSYEHVSAKLRAFLISIMEDRYEG